MGVTREITNILINILIKKEIGMDKKYLLLGRVEFQIRKLTDTLGYNSLSPYLEKQDISVIEQSISLFEDIRSYLIQNIKEDVVNEYIEENSLSSTNTETFGYKNKSNE